MKITGYIGGNNNLKSGGRKRTLCPNIIVLAVSPLWRGDGPIVITSEVLAVPIKTFRSQTHTAQIRFIKIKDALQF